MKVLHIEDRFHPDMGYQINYFAEFHDRLIDFNILSSKSFSLWNVTDPNYLLTKRDREFENNNDVKIIRLDSSLTRGNKYNIWLRKLFETIERINPDVIYVHAIETLTAVRVILSRLSKKFLIVSDTHMLLNQHNKGLTGKAFQFFLHNYYVPVINSKDIVVFYTAEENKLILLDIYGIKSENVKPCLIGTNLKDYKYDSEVRKSLRAKFNIEPFSKVILYAGKFNYRKQPHLLLEAMKGIENKRTTKVHLVCIGAMDQDYMKEKFHFSFDENKIKVHILDSISNKELYKYYSMADFAVFPKENTLSALDAQACKLPVIMEEDFTNKERLSAGGLVYQKNNTDDLASKIIYLLENEETLKDLSERGYNYMRNNYNYEIIVKRMEEIIMRKYEDFSKVKNVNSIKKGPN